MLWFFPILVSERNMTISLGSVTVSINFCYKSDRKSSGRMGKSYMSSTAKLISDVLRWRRSYDISNTRSWEREIILRLGSKFAQVEIALCDQFSPTLAYRAGEPVKLKLNFWQHPAQVYEPAHIFGGCIRIFKVEIGHLI